MSHKLDSLVDSSFENNDSVIGKWRRLKIQESLFLKNINKLISKEHESEFNLPILYCLDFKQFSKKIKDSYNEINMKFEDIKAESEEKLSCLDIETMKRDVIKLDDKIRIFKNFIQTEFTSTASQEEKLTKAVNFLEEKQTNCPIKPKLRSNNPFKHIVPSPVKVLIKSPFKCKEVQDLQEFMMNSPNRYGGWNEYNHNIFVQIWQKHFYADITKDVFELHVIVGNTNNFEAFQKEVLHKIAGSTKEDIISHQKWYSQYLCLKEKQQNALNKWRKNQQILSKTSNTKHQGDQNKKYNSTKSFRANTKQTVKNIDDVLNTVESIESNEAEEIASALCNMSFQNEDLPFHSETDKNSVASSSFSEDMNEEKKSFSSILKPTKQWTNRCSSSRDPVKTNYDVEKIRKLRIPDWRLTLQD
ncbi:uncharacterized protein isoform X2 [Choristoneura fumiferana]|uniref:uncharacterized protein isoform X2 n=1 Tax=Choristoneura fumiferana TaxID=7141 RepID=UPI003D157B50